MVSLVIDWSPLSRVNSALAPTVQPPHASLARNASNLTLCLLVIGPAGAPSTLPSLFPLCIRINCYNGRSQSYILPYVLRRQLKRLFGEGLPCGCFIDASGRATDLAVIECPWVSAKEVAAPPLSLSPYLMLICLCLFFIRQFGFCFVA
jgi:hypothetical protein